METKYTARFNGRTLAASIHATSCPVANNTPRGFVCFPIEGATAAEAAAEVYTSQDFETRGLKFPTICKCAK